jgi:hypothetical protein
MRFEAGLQNMSRGLAMFDREQRLVICARKHFAIDQPTRDVIPGARWQVGFADLPASPESITPGGMGDAPCRNCKTCGYGFLAPLAEPVLGRRVAPIRVLAAPE